MKVKSVYIEPSTSKGKKFSARFVYVDPAGGDRQKTVHFGAEGASDFTKHKDEDRKQRYIKRHEKREAKLWEDSPMTPATLSRFILWNKPTLKSSFADYKRRFKIKGGALQQSI